MARLGRRPGPSDTRPRILSAAAASFAAKGYDGTSMRQVASAAGVDPALVRHFFGTKEKLFTEVATSIIRPDEAIGELVRGPRSRLGERLASYFLGLLGDVGAPGPLLGLVRSAVTSEPAAALMREFLAEEVLGRIAVTLHAEEPDLRAALAASQLVGLAIARYAVGFTALTRAVGTSTGLPVFWKEPSVQYIFCGVLIGAPETM